jgi:glycosyltransferase involved in cell wall biosynthesis
LSGPASPLKVAVVAPSLRILGGQAVQADRLLSAWRNDPDVEAWLVPINPEPPGPLRRGLGIKYLRTVVTELTYLPLLFRELSRADVVHVFSASYFSFLLAPLPAIAVARVLGKPVVLNYHSGEAPDHLHRSAIARFVLARVEQNVVPSRFLVGVFARFGLEATVIANTVDQNRFRFRLRQTLAPRLITNRNFEAHYNVACTIRAFQRVQSRHPDASLTVIGAGPEEGRLRRLADDLELRNVTFAGRVAPDEMPGYYENNDIYVQTPNIDNMPLSVIEAYASGLPVVSTNAGGVPSILTDDVHGLLAPLDDHDLIAAQVLRLIGEPHLAMRIARAAYAACAAFTWDAVRDQWLSTYRSVLRDDREAAGRLPAEGRRPPQPAAGRDAS